MSYVSEVCQFPVIGAGQVPFYKHPYKMFALAPLTLLFWRAMQVAGEMGAFGDLRNVTFSAINLACVALHGGVLVQTTLLAKEFDPNSGLRISVQGADLMTAFNYLDTMYSTVHDVDAKWVVMRVAMVSFSVFFMVLLVVAANRDRLYTVGAPE